MRRPGPKLVQLLLAAATCSFLLLMTTHADANAGATCVPHERDALLAFKRGITRDRPAFSTCGGSRMARASCRTVADGEASGAATAPAMSSSFDLVTPATTLFTVAQLWLVR
jgi:hypothetical protein